MPDPIASSRSRVKGYQRVSQQFLADSSHLTDAEHRLLIQLYSFQRKATDQPFPSYNLLAKRCGWSKPKTIRTCKSLEDKGLVVVERRLTDAGDPDSNRYTLPEGVVTPVDHQGGPPMDQGGPPMDQGGPPVLPEEEEGNKRGGDGGSGGDLELSLIANYCSPAVSAFDQFWSAYPRKRGKEAARKAWKRLKPDRALLEAILRAVETEKKNGWADPQFIPYPATWLNRGQWQDEAEGPDRSLTAWRST